MADETPPIPAPAPAAPPTPATPPAPPAESLTALSGRLREETARREAAETRAASAVKAEQTVTIYNALGKVDPDLAAEMLAKHAMLPAESRPELGSWATSLVAQPPKWMQGYMAPAPAPAPAPGPAPALVPVPAPVPAPVIPPTGGAGGAVPPLGGGSGASASVSATAIAAARAQARVDNDWSKVTALLQQAAKIR